MNDYHTIKNWTGKGQLLASVKNVTIKKGDNYIGVGLAGDNVFTAPTDFEKKEVKVIAISKDLEWGKTGNNTLSGLPKLDFS